MDWVMVIISFYLQKANRRKKRLILFDSDVYAYTSMCITEKRNIEKERCIRIREKTCLMD